jgi:sulfotransferase
MNGKTFFFISGLPRSGSTLLCNILAQNPKFHVSKATSGLHDVLFNIRNQWDKMVEHKAEGVDYERLRRVLHGVFSNYYDTDKSIIIDKGRGWLPLIEMAEFALQVPVKIICPVRDVSEILASFERIYRKVAAKSQSNFEENEYMLSQTVEGRCEILSRLDQPVGLAYNRVNDALLRGHKDKIKIVEFDDLTSSPDSTLSEIYEFLGLENFKHDFENVSQYTSEKDEEIHGVDGLHSIRQNVQPIAKNSQQILGSVAEKYRNIESWRTLKNHA